MKSYSSRRSFLQKNTVIAGTLLMGSFAVSASRPNPYKAAVIGRTGRGDYGHGLDTIFNDLENVTVVAVADEDPTGLKNARERSGASRAYTDYREMLEKEKPNLVSIASRQPDCHRDMALAAIEVGAHLYLEKPITEFPREADEILFAAQAKGLKVAVAHTRRFMDHFLRMKKLVDEGYLGEIMDVRFQGKQDARVGGEDLIVLGSHDMDIMRWFWGDPNWCFASVAVEGRDAAPGDVRAGLSEPYTVAGDTIHAVYRLTNNLHCSWRSVKAENWNKNFTLGDRTVSKWGFDIYGTQRVLSFQESLGAFVLDCPFIAPGLNSASWKPVEDIVSFEKPPILSHPIRNLIHAIETDGKPQCSGEDARWAVEMVCAVYESHKTKGRVSFPLSRREHPLRAWKA